MDRQHRFGWRFWGPGSRSRGATQAAATPPHSQAKTRFLMERLEERELLAADIIAATVQDAVEGINYQENAENNQNVEAVPPAPSGAAGPGHLVSTVFSSIEWHDKNSGVQQFSSSLNSFFQPLNPVSDFLSSTKVFYDPTRDQFIVAALDLDTTNLQSRILLAVSKTADPNDDFFFQAINTVFPINQTVNGLAVNSVGLAADEEAIYLTANTARLDTGVASGSRLWILDKGVMDGNLSNARIFNPQQVVGSEITTTLMPTKVYGNVPNNVGTWLVGYNGVSDDIGADPTSNEFLTIIRVDFPLTNPSFQLQYVFSGDIDATLFNGNQLLDATQRPSDILADPDVLIETLDRRVYDAVWRDDNLYLVSQVIPNGQRTNPNPTPTGTPFNEDAEHTNVHWWRVSTASLNGLVVADQGTIGGEEIDDDPNSFVSTYNPSVAVDASGNMVIGFNASSVNFSPGSYFVSRRSDDRVSATSDPVVLTPGVNYYVRTFGGNTNFWTLQSATIIDPDNATFWSFQQYAFERDFERDQFGQDGQWGTRWNSLTYNVAGAGEISGVVFNDLNANGVRESNEPGLANFTVFLDADNNGIFDFGEQSVLSDALGGYNFSGLPNGQYIVRQQLPNGFRQTAPASGNFILDVNDDGFADNNFGVTFDPANLLLNLNQPVINETGSVTLIGSFTDLDLGEIFQILVNWGDGTSSTVTSNTPNFQVSHTYGDDNPAGTASDQLPINVQILAQSNAMLTGNTQVTINNTNPQVLSIDGPDLAAPGFTVPFTINFRDLGFGPTETFRFSIDFGDGTSAVTGVAPVTSPGSPGTPSRGTFTVNHTFNRTGNFNVTATLFDDDLGIGSLTVPVEVAVVTLQPDPDNPGLNYLLVSGTNEDERFLINEQASTGEFVVFLNNREIGRGTNAGLSRIEVRAQGGNDFVEVFRTITVPVWVYGGNGNDTLIGGAGNDLLLGETGNDELFGGWAGRDILIGGEGIDLIRGFSGRLPFTGDDSDIIIGGSSTALTSSQWNSTVQLWNGGDDYLTRITNLRNAATPLNNQNIFDDAVVDTLYGGPSLDWFFGPETPLDLEGGELIDISGIPAPVILGESVAGADFVPTTLGALPFTDLFAQEDGTPLAQTWLPRVGTFSASGNRMVATGTGLHLATVNGLALADVVVNATVDFATTAGNSFVGLVARYSGDGDANMLFATLARRDNQVVAEIWRNLKGYWTLLTSQTLAQTPAQVQGANLSFEVIGSSLTLRLDGLVVANALDASLLGPGLAGIRASAGASYEAFSLNQATMTAFADAFTGRQELGNNYGTAVGGFTLADDQLTSSSTPVNLFVYRNANLADVVATAEVTLASNGNSHAGLVLRYAGDGDNNHYLGLIARRGEELFAEIWRNLDGIYNRLISEVVTINNPANVGGVLEFSAIGNLLRLRFDGQTIATMADNTILRAGLAGVRTSAGVVVDDFAIDPASPTVAISDNFDRGDNDTIGTQFTETTQGDFAIADNKLRAVTEGVNLTFFQETSLLNGSISAEYELAADGNSFVGLVARAEGSMTGDLLLAMVARRAGTLSAEFWEQVGGIWTRLAATNLGTGLTGSLRFDFVGQQLSLFVNDSLILMGQAASFVTPGLVGLRNSAGVLVDNFTLTPATVADVSDNFDRVDLGNNFFQPLGGAAIRNDALVTTQPGVNLLRFTPALFADVTVQTDYTLADSGNSFVGLTARHTSNVDQDLYLGMLARRNGETRAEIWRNIDGVYTLLFSRVISTTNTGRLRFQVVGNSLALSVNDTVEAIVLDDAITGAGGVGIRSAVDVLHDNFAVNAF